MMGPRQVEEAALFYEFSLERHTSGHPRAEIDCIVCRRVQPELLQHILRTSQRASD